MLIYIDIETIPGQAPWVKEFTDSTVHPPGNIKKPESIQKWFDEKGEQAKADAWHKTGLDATMGEIAVISYVSEEGAPPLSVYRGLNGSEANLLKLFFDTMKLRTESDRGRRTQLTFCGHCVLFDLGFIWRRAVIHGIRPCEGFPVVHELKPWSAEIIDTCNMWRGTDKSTSGSMEALCKAFGLEGKGDIDGSMVWDEIQKGNPDKVVTYCEADVERTRQIHRRMMFQEN